MNGLQIRNLLRSELPGVEIRTDMRPARGIVTMGIVATRGDRTANATLQSGKRDDVLAVIASLRAALA